MLRAAMPCYVRVRFAAAWSRRCNRLALGGVSCLVYGAPASAAATAVVLHGNPSEVRRAVHSRMNGEMDDGSVTRHE